MPVVVHGRGMGDADTDFPARTDLAYVLDRIHEEVRVARLLVRQLELPDALASHMISALREALLVRIFRLRHFYYGESEARREIVASDYFADPTAWYSTRPPAAAHLSRWLDDLEEWIGSRVQLLPEGRVPPEAWPLAALVEALVSAHRAFCEAVVEEHGEELPGGPWRSAPEAGNPDLSPKHR